MGKRTLVVGLVVTVVVSLLILADRCGRNDPVEAPVFEPATSFCAEFRASTFVQQIEGVSNTRTDLRPRVARVEAGFLRQIGELDDVPGDARPLLRELAGEVAAGARTGTFGDAAEVAAALDGVAAERCR
ncbi:MAG TPA: hypothetical protein VNQ33_06365 [Acidimicrobiales bacterium]|nr:hypothetical protein [Acidimicrobiales bacterium]